MQRHRFAGATAALLAAGLAARATAQNLTPVPQEQADQIAANIGAQLAAKPAKPRRILVFWRCEGFVHGKALEFGNKAIELAAVKTKAFTADFSNDYEALKPENLDRYDAVVLNNTTGLKTQENRLVEPALVAFVRSGKGLAVIHAGADNFNKAEQAAEMVGGRFWGHPWGGGGTWAFKLDEPGHPLNKAFGGKNFKAGDEIYQQQSPFYNRAKLRVLISLDFSDPATRDAQGQRRTDGDYAVSWIRPYGKGRVFYTSFGHDERTFLDKARLTHILDGIQYVLGDLKADDSPSGLSAADLARVSSATDSNANEAFAFLQDILAHTGHAPTDAANRAKLEALLKDPAASVFGKRAVLRALLAAGAPADLAPVAACLRAPETREWAAAILAGAPGSAADRALVQAFAGADVELRCTLLHALAIRKNTAAIVPHAADKDPAVAAAALAALGGIGDETALAALSKPAAPALQDSRRSALAACIGTLAASGNAKAAARAAKPLFEDPSSPAPLRAACAQALLLADSSFFAVGIKDSCLMVRQTVIRAADAVPPRTLAATLKTAAPDDQAALLAKLAARDARACAQNVAEMLGSDQDAVVIEALRALTTIGTTSAVPAILALAARDGAVGAAARDALADYRAPDTGEALIALARQDPSQQPRVLALLGERAEAKLLPKLEFFLKADSDDTRKEAWKALGKSADDRSFAQLVAWLPLVKPPEINQAEAALRAAAKNVETAPRAAAFAGAWSKSPSTAKRVLAGLMPAYADDRFLSLLAGALADADNGLRETALRALADWPGMAPYAVLKDAVASQTDAGLKTAALRGALKLVAAHAGSDARTRLTELFTIAPDDKGRMTVADALFKAEGLEMFPLLQGLFNDPVCGAAAKKAYAACFDAKLKGHVGGAADIEPAKWKANASHAGNDAGRAFDRNPDSRWSSNRGSEKGMWFALDLGEKVFVAELTLDTEKSAGDTPNGYEVYTSDDGKNWTGPVAQGDSSSRGKTVIPLAVQTRHLKIVTSGGRPGLFWSIHEIYAKAGLDPKKVEAIRQVADSIR